MSKFEHIPEATDNRILSLLDEDELNRILPALEPVSLNLKQVLYEPGAPIQHAYFPNSGVLSMLSVIDNESSVEAATIGNEGMAGIQALLGSNSTPGRMIVQVPGRALRMKAADLRAESQRGGPLVTIILRYIDGFLTQITQSVACNTLHALEKRFCRWLLMTHDRVGSDHFPITHEFLSLMLGVRRSSVTEVARRFQNAGIIRYIHGKLTVLDRPALEAASCTCYRAVKDNFEKLLGSREPTR